MWRALGRSLYRETTQHGTNFYRQMSISKSVGLMNQNTNTTVYWKPYHTSPVLLSPRMDEEMDDPVDNEFMSRDRRIFNENDRQLLTPASLKEILNERTASLNICPLKSISDVMDYFRTPRQCSTSECLTALSLLTEFNAGDQFNEPFLRNLLNQIDKLADQMTASESIFCLHYLLQLNTSIDEAVSQKLIKKIRDSLRNGDSSLSIKDLARFARIIKFSCNKYLSSYLNIELLPLVFRHLNDCTNVRDFYHVTLCFHNMNKLIWKLEDNWTIYEDVLKRILNEKNCQFEHHELLEIITFLNDVSVGRRNVELHRRILLMLKPRIPSFNEAELELIFRSFMYALEPFELFPVIYEAANQKMINNKDPSVELLTCCVLSELPEKRKKLIQEFDKIISNKQDLFCMDSILYRALRILRISNTKILDRYWGKITEELQTDHQQENGMLPPKSYVDDLQHNYTYFNNNLGGTYRCKQFEEVMIDIFMNDIKHGISGLSPSKFTRAASFILAFGNAKEGSDRIPDFIVDKIESMADQFRSSDCLALSRGLQIFLGAHSPYSPKEDIAHKIYRIQTVLNYNFERHINCSNLEIGKLNKIVKAFICQKTSTNTPFFDLIAQKYEEQFDRDDLNLNSRHIRTMIYNLYSTSLFIPKVADKVLKYIYDNREYVTGSTIARVLHCFFKLGYEPSMSDNALIKDISLEEIGAAIYRDFDFINANNIVRSCLALCYFRALPQNLIDRIFHIDFITRLEEEIKLCYSKNVYPQRILNDVMQLNRAVCFEYPEARVPWFQQSYIEAQISKLPVRKNRFTVDIYNKLVAFVKDAKFLKLNHVTPYGYQIEFVLHMDRNKKFLVPIEENESHHDVFKIAVIPVHKQLHSYNNNSLLGVDHLKERHLQILGYHVVLITYHDWNSMHMNLPGVKLEFLREKLLIQ